MAANDRPIDHDQDDAESSGSSRRSELEKNVTAGSTWLRLLFMLIFGFLYGLSRLVVGAVVIIQFFHVLFSGDTNRQLKTFGHSLAIYSFEIVNYLTFNTETKPFPLEAEWPTSLGAGNDTGYDEADDEAGA